MSARQGMSFDILILGYRENQCNSLLVLFVEDDNFKHRRQDTD